MTIDLSRQRALVPTTLSELLVTLVGCGNLGSACAIALTRAGVRNFTLWDGDVVEAANIATQQYEPGQIGEPKVVALRDILQRYSTYVDVRAHNFAASSSDAFNVTNLSTFILGTDNIESRRAAFSAIQLAVSRNRTPTNVLVIDPRMAFEDFTIWAVRASGDDSARDEYLKILQDTKQTYDAGTCGASSVGATGMGVAGFVAPVIRRWLNGATFPKLLIGNFASGEVKSYWRNDEPENDEMAIINAARKAEADALIAAQQLAKSVVTAPSSNARKR